MKDAIVNGFSPGDDEIDGLAADSLTYSSSFHGFELTMPREDAEDCTRPGPADDAVAYLVNIASVSKQLDSIGPDAIRDDLRETGAWDAEDLQDDEQNRHRIVWIAACDAVEFEREGNGE